MRNVMLTVTVIVLLGSIGLFAQSPETNKKVPLDPKVRYGKLDNGMTYYIRANDLPNDRADFYIVFNVGAILENDDQDGLAHLTEHMAFNGTKNFPKKGVLDFLERNGVAFGHNVNAFTSVDVTAYNLNDVPVSDESVVDTALLILNDWSSYVAFEDEEIDAERKVVHEEWRTRRSADFRMMKELMPTIYQGSKYAMRDVIGSLDVIDNCDYHTLRSFYSDWYRPDLEALIIVGDFNADVMEEKVKTLFSQVPKAVNPIERTIYEIPNNKEPLIGIATDPEAQRNTIRVYYKHDNVKPEDKNVDYMRELLVRQLYNTMINNRLNELVQKENPPFIVGYSMYSGMQRSKDAFTLIAFAKDNEIPISLSSVLRENERVRQHGFTQSELDRTKKDILRRYEKSYKEKDKQKNNNYIWEYFSNYLTNEPSPGIEFEYDFAKKTLPEISLDEINSLPTKWITEENIVVSITGLEKEGVSMPEESEVLSIIQTTRNVKLEPYVDAVLDKPLVEVGPTPSKIINTETNDELGTKTWTLENGAKVIIKKTDFKEDEILFQATSFGGSSLYELEKIPSADMTTSIVSQSGVGEFDNISLEKMLAGKVLRLNPFLSNIAEGFNGSASPEDLETFMQLLYLYFEQPRYDEEAFGAYMSRIKSFLKNTSTDPRTVANDSISFLMADRNPRRSPMNSDKLNKVDFDKIVEIFNDRFRDGSDFRFYFVGNIDEAKLAPLVETYIGGIVSEQRKETWKDNNVRPPADNAVNKFKMQMETPKATVFVNYNGDSEYNAENLVYLSAIQYILSLRYTETIREEQGGSYGVGVWKSTTKYPYEGFELNMKFDCAPERAEALKAIVYEEVEKLQSEGPKEVDVHKTIEYFIKTREEDLKENRFWLNSLVSMDNNNLNTISDANYVEIVKEMTPEKLQKFSKELFDGSKNVEVVMLPVEKE
ncbi:MAG: insulinase family protein [Bacteroidetes bacterium]|nr:insulinase family protein [Bacteroidota bacterium]MBL6943392.1 insulinase family protein [Bacteroidales bacterium]